MQADWGTAPVSDQIRATLGFLEQLTLRPAEVTRSDAAAVAGPGAAPAGGTTTFRCAFHMAQFPGPPGPTHP